MSINASYSGLSQDLTVTGDGVDNSIIVGRTAGGTLLVNGGAVPIIGGPATVAITDLIAMSGGLGNDDISLDETNGALPAAELAGGGGNDTLTGGSGADLLQGEAGDDTLFGRGNVDLLYGGDNNDTLVGGDGDDQLFGELGNDRMIWNPGDDSDLWEGGDGSDTGEINGGNGAETFTISANGTRVRFDRIDPAPFTLDIGTTEALVLNANGGDDTISTSGNLSPLIALTIDGGAGNDTILGGNGADLILGGDGNDFIDGNQGADTALLGAGDDVFQWDPGDGSDIVEGQADTDTLVFNGSAANEIFAFSANGARVQATRNVGAIVLDVNDVEHFTINALAGIDAISVNDLTGTDATQFDINLAATIGGATGDAAVDTVTVNGSGAAESIAITGSGTSVSVAGLPAMVNITNVEAANDSLTVNGGGGNDTINASTLPGGVVKLSLDGGTGDDTILGSAGADILIGNDGNDVIDGNQGADTAFLGAGNDVFTWDPGDGSDIVEGQAGNDELQFNGSNASENVNIAANGGRVLLTRDVAAIAMDLDDIEKITFRAIGGADNVTIGDLTGTDATQVEVRLGASGGGGDGAVDTVTVTGTGAGVADNVTVSSLAGVVTASGLAASVSIFDAEGATDRLTFNLGADSDTFNASGLAAGLLSLTVNGGLGADLVIGSAGADLVIGGDGNDSALLGAGNDTFVWNPGDDNDIIEGQAGTDQLTFNGANIAESITISANGGRTAFFRDVAAVTMDMNDTEVIRFAALGGIDTITVNDLSGTDTQSLIFDLAGTIGGSTGDGAVDTVTLNGSTGNDTVTSTAGVGTFTINGLAAAVTINTSEATDVLDINVGDGDDNVSVVAITAPYIKVSVDAGDGNDTIRSAGDGTYLGGSGNDLIYAGLTYSSEILDGGTGVDTLDTTSWGGVYNINMATGVTNYSGESFTNFENLITGAGADTITGTDSANIIKTGGGVDNISSAGGNDTLDGGAGADTMAGGLGNDTYLVDNAGDLVTENVGEGNDKVLASVSYTLGVGTEVEQLMTSSAAGTTAINLTGNDLANTITGNAGNNTLDGLGGNDTLIGGVGADTLMGGLGDDTYSVDNVGDVVLEGAAAGTDLVVSTISYTLPTNVEKLTLGGSAAINATGNSLNNQLIGNGAANTLVGGAGADTLMGGLGDDTYSVDNVGDVVLEGAASGVDRVVSSITYTLPSNVEKLNLSGSAAINGTGNSLDNFLFGNDAANTLIGGAGADTLMGGLGDDIYSVDNVGDVVLEGAAAGTDLVVSTISYILPTNVEKLTLGGAAAINATGNSLNNQLIGNGAANTLDGKAGGDTMQGGLGDDTYVVDNVGDVVLDGNSAGTDLVQSAISYTLPTNIENLTLTGAAAINATGNTVGNVITGNGAANVLSGKEGNDTLIGGAGNDLLYGGNGNDTLDGGANADQFIFNNALNAATNVDTINGFVPVDDTIDLSHAVFSATGPNGTLALAAFYTGPSAHDADDRIIYNSATGDLYYDADGNGAGATQTLFAHLAPGLALTNADFLVIA